MRHFIAITKALSDETRVRIMKVLEQGEVCVCELMEILQMGQSTVSKHLGVLHSAGLVERRRVGTWCYYRLSEETVNKYSPMVKNLLRQVLNDDKQVKEDIKRLKNLKSRASTCKPLLLKTKELGTK